LTPRESSNPSNKEYVASPFVHIAVTSYPVLSKVSKAILAFSREANLYIMKKTATKGATATTRVVGCVLSHSIWTVHYIFPQHVKVNRSVKSAQHFNPLSSRARFLPEEEK